MTLFLFGVVAGMLGTNLFWLVTMRNDEYEKVDLIEDYYEGD